MKLADRTRLFTALTVLHPLTDLASAALYMYVADAIWLAVLYNAVAFALQLPLGCLLDRAPCPLRLPLWLSWGLLTLGAASYVLAGDPVVAIALACLGNALFHIAAGRHLLNEDRGRAGRTSLFISTGAIGLLLGMRLGADYPLWTIVPALLAFLLILVWIHGCAKVVSTTNTLVAPSLPDQTPIFRKWGWAMLLGLSAIIVWRSYTVLDVTQSFNAAQDGLGWTLALAFCSFAGQALGGFASDRFGSWKVLVVGLLAGAGLVWLCPVTFIPGMLLLMLAAQLATGPLLPLLYRAASARAGLAFGVNCMALFISTLISHFPAGFPRFCAGEWLTLALEYAATSWVRLPNWFGAIATVNIVTHPALMYVVSRLGMDWPVVLVGELTVVVVEGALLAWFYRRRWQWWKLMAISLFMNATSYFTWELLKN